MENTLLAIDCGTQSLRALLFSTRGHLVHKVKVDYEPCQSPRPGWAEQEARLYWMSLCEAIRTLKLQAPQAFAGIRGVGVAAQRDSLVLVDAGGEPVRPAILWLDNRKASPVYRPGLLASLALGAVGMREAVLRAQEDGKTNWVKEHEPHVWSRVARVLLLSGYLNHRLTGQFRDSVASQIAHLPFHFRAMRWSRPGELASRLFPLDPSLLPALLPPGSILGEVGREAAEATGLPPGLPVVACASDKGAETVGVGCVDESSAALSFGTTATVQTTTPRYFEPLAFMPAYPAALPGHHNPEVEIFRGYWMISWFKKELAAPEVQEAAALGLPAEAVLDRLLRQVPPGSMGLVTLPHWGPGLKRPLAKGALVGFGDVHTRAHVYRSVIEGLAFALREGLERIESAGGLQLERIAISGGATQSREICQITADVLGRPLAAGETFESTGLGTAIMVAAGVGLHASIPAAVEAMVRPGRTFEPDPAAARLYERLYRRVFLRLHGRLHPLFRQVQAILGYPPEAGGEV